MTRIVPVASPTMRRTLRTTLTGVLAASTLIATVACMGADAGTGPRTTTDPETPTGQGTPNTKAAGLYALMTVNKKAIPFEIYRGRYYYAPVDYTFDDLSITVTGGELTLQADGQFHMAVDLLFAANGGQDRGTRSFNGRYRINGQEITLTDGGGPVTAGFRDGYVVLDFDPGQTGGWQTYYFKIVP